MIALIGSHGTGKTTLLKELKKQRSDLVIVDGDSRTVHSFNEIIGYKLSVKDQQFLINILSDARWPIDIQLENLCTTRTPLDHYAYSKALGFHGLAESRLELLKVTDLSSIKFFYLPIEFGIVDDGVRYTGDEFQREIDSILNTLITGFKIDAITLKGNVSERVETLLKHI